MSKRTYNEKEVAKLFERAAELQAISTRRADASGLTLDDLEHVAEEAGIDPSLLRQAAIEMEEPALNATNAGRDTSATHIFVERRIAGPLTEDAWENIVFELRHRFESDFGGMMGMPQYGKGATEEIGKTREWKHTSAAGVETRVMVRPVGDSTMLRLSQRVGIASTWAESIFYGFILAFLASGGGAIFADSGLTGVLIGVATLAAAIPLIYVADKAWRGSKHKALEELGNALTGLIADSASKTTASEPPLSANEKAKETWAKLDLDNLPDDLDTPMDEASAQRKRSRE